MNDPFRPNAKPPLNAALLQLWIIWFALLMGPIAFLVASVLLVLPHRVPADPPMWMLVWVNAGMLVTVVPVALLIRRFIFRRARNEHGINAIAYSAGNIVFWAACEAVAFVGLVVALVNGSLKPTIFIVAIAFALQVAAFPRSPRLES
jgi:hypothetical protein